MVPASRTQQSRKRWHSLSCSPGIAGGELTRPLLTLEGTMQAIIMSERTEVRQSKLPDDAFEKVSFSEGGTGPLIKDADMTHSMGMHIPKLCYVEVAYSDNFTEKYRWYAQHDAWGLEAS
jgi:hypothetical protein